MTEPSAVYALSLLRLGGMDRRTAIRLLTRYPTEDALREAAEADLAAAAGPASGALLADISRDWPRASEWAERELARHAKAGVHVVPFGSAAYPPLLAVAPDPPAILYVRGEVGALRALLTVAVIGTRTPTLRGQEIARRLGRRFAEGGAVVVSGLAAGIDTSGHEGALEAGRTVAVLGTAIDTVYPPENEGLARRIEERGALISEYPLGCATGADAFVARDRIQAGLSVAVLPVQMGLAGGTQHTVHFAFEARRRVRYPRLPEAERRVPQNEGIVALMEDGRATPFDIEDIPRLLSELPELREELLRSASEPRQA